MPGLGLGADPAQPLEEVGLGLDLARRGSERRRRGSQDRNGQVREERNPRTGNPTRYGYAGETHPLDYTREDVTGGGVALGELGVAQFQSPFVQASNARATRSADTSSSGPSPGGRLP